MAVLGGFGWLSGTVASTEEDGFESAKLVSFPSGSWATDLCDERGVESFRALPNTLSSIVRKERSFARTKSASASSSDSDSEVNNPTG
jgi:hypothetical protein